MNNFEWVKTFNKDDMARFINLYRPSCNEWCKDAKVGCAFSCNYNGGTDVIRKWLDKDVNDEDKI